MYMLIPQCCVHQIPVGDKMVPSTHLLVQQLHNKHMIDGLDHNIQEADYHGLSYGGA